jgi:DNA repair photolyase
MAQNNGKWLDAPKSTNTVRVRMVDTTLKMVLHSISFIEPVIPEHKDMNMTDVAFLIENQKVKKLAMFDLGVRKDFWNLSPMIQKRLDGLALGLRADKDVPEILRENSISLEHISQ